MTKYDTAFKEEAIRLALTSPQAIAKTARDLKIKKATLYQWVSAAKSNSPIETTKSGENINIIE
jgi:transposase-like protein